MHTAEWQLGVYSASDNLRRILHTDSCAGRRILEEPGSCFNTEQCFLQHTQVASQPTLLAAGSWRTRVRNTAVCLALPKLCPFVSFWLSERVFSGSDALYVWPLWLQQQAQRSLPVLSVCKQTRISVFCVRSLEGNQCLPAARVRRSM